MARLFPLGILIFALLGSIFSAPCRAAVPAMPDRVFAKPVPSGGRLPFSPDAVLRAQAEDAFTFPAAPGDGWEAVEADEPGVYPVRRGSYAAMVVTCDAPQTLLLVASGHSHVWVNGEPRAGDAYGYGFLRLPVALQQGENQLLFRHGRGALRVAFETPPAEVFVSTADLTAPDFRQGNDETLPVGVVVTNTTTRPVTAIPWSGTGDGEHGRIEGTPVTVPAMTIRKVNVPVHYDGRPGERLSVTLGFGEHAAVDARLDLVAPGEVYRRTFISRVDGSVQYYAIRPRETPAEAEPAIVLSLHGAGVEASGQARAYGAKPWCDIVCPTNRRPFGFDWEDWGRIDALEVLDDAMRHLGSDRHRVYLTGHSMGGHGTWSIGTLHADRFAAIAPSAGWLSFASYGGGRGYRALLDATAGIPAAFAEVARITEAESRLERLRGKGVYLLHGDADDNVPVTQAREAARLLTDLGIAYERHEQPGAGHWWDGEKAAGADCVDWPPIFEMFDRHRLETAATPPAAEQATVSPGFKRVFDHNALLVYDDEGTPEEVAWARNKARFDSETMYYRGNGGFEIASATDALSLLEKGALAGRNVVFYGAGSPSGFLERLLPAGIASAAGIESVPSDAALLAVVEHHAGGVRLLGFVGGDGISGARLTEVIPYFVSGVHYPDICLFDADVFESGLDGVISAATGPGDVSTQPAPGTAGWQ